MGLKAFTSSHGVDSTAWILLPAGEQQCRKGKVHDGSEFAHVCLLLSMEYMNGETG
ncbi:MAG: hypothetical protein WBO57_03910 [Gammaproteobacteria bacterium]